ncbi:MAG TPA: DUF4175 family protein, partial [Rhodanobacteraceae bacterium]
AAATRNTDLARIFRWRRPIVVATIGVLAAGAGVAMRGPQRPRLGLRAVGTPRAAPLDRTFAFQVRVMPPSYTRLPSIVLDNPAQITVVEGSAVTVTARDDGHVLARVTASKTDYVVFDTPSGARRTLPIVVTPDALPSVTLTAPGKDLVFAGSAARIAFEARATDDFGLTTLTLHYTKVSGSGEQFAFQDGEIPLHITRDTARVWRGDAARSLGDLRLDDGDMLVYRAVASDARGAGGEASSDAFFIEISRTGVAAAEAFTLPEQETRYALSQQMLIVKTDRLQQQRGSMAPDALRETALNLAVEQRMISAEFVFMLGGEVQDEEVEAAQSTELQEGRLENRGQRDLRTATVAMSQSEQLLTAIDLSGALSAERAAVEALQRAFARDRYILRALASRANLDVTRRLTGDVSSARDWKRTIAPVAENRRAALLEDALRGLADLAADADRSSPDFDRRARVLAETLLRTDTSSAPLRDAAVALQRAADARDGAARRTEVAAAATAVAAVARAASAEPVVDVAGPAPALSGAFASALRRLR